MKKQYYFATHLRTTGALLILLCHFTAQSSYEILNMSSQFLNIGVEMFLILSGFLFGVGGDEPVKQWYIKRVKRIYVPYELFVFFLAAIYLVLGYNILKLDWLWLVLGVQGSIVGVWGAEQTWFITPLLICYLLTPIIKKILNEIRTKKYRIMLMTMIGVMPIVWALFENSAIYVLLTPVSCYLFALILGHYFNNVKVNNKYLVYATCIMICSFGIRVILKCLCDGTIFYDRIIVKYTQMLAAFCIFYIFVVIFENIKPNRIVNFISTISFEIYLFHYMFCVGPIRLFEVTSSWLINCLLVVVATLIISVIVNRISQVIVRSLR